MKIMKSNNKIEIALVTGAGGAIGSAIAKKLGKDGFIVVCVDNNESLARQVAMSIPNAVHHVVDVSIESDLVSLRADLNSTIGDPTLIVNCAGIFFLHDLIETDTKVYDQIMDINLKGTFLVCKTFIPAFLLAGKGIIINIASTAGLEAGFHRSIYSAAKAGVILLTRSISADYGAKGVRANCICPGLIDTPMAEWLRSDPIAFKRWEKSLPAQRVGNVEEIASVVSFLASDASSYMHGSTVVVDGGSMV